MLKDRKVLSKGKILNSKYYAWKWPTLYPYLQNLRHVGKKLEYGNLPLLELTHILGTWRAHAHVNKTI